MSDRNQEFWWERLAGASAIPLGVAPTVAGTATHSSRQ